MMFPTEDHSAAAEVVATYAAGLDCVDTVLVVNSCARGQAVPESDLDMAILMDSPIDEARLEAEWHRYAASEHSLIAFRSRGPFSALHIDFFDGTFKTVSWDDGGGPDDYEIEIGNRVAYAVALHESGPLFRGLQASWLPYYEESLSNDRFIMVRDACLFDLDHVPFFMNRSLHLQAFDRLHKAFREYLQALFIANRTYPLAYNKWLAHQLASIGKSELYEPLLGVLSISDLRTDELCDKADLLRELAEDL